MDTFVGGGCARANIFSRVINTLEFYILAPFNHVKVYSISHYLPTCFIKSLSTEDDFDEEHIPNEEKDKSFLIRSVCILNLFELSVC